MLFELSKNKFKQRLEAVTLERFQKILKRVSYKSNFSAVAFDHDEFLFNPDYGRPPFLEMRIHVLTRCSRTGSNIEIVHRNQFDFAMAARMEDSELILWIQNCFRKAEMHEFNEFFKVDGVVFDDPHKGEV